MIDITLVWTRGKSRFRLLHAVNVDVFRTVHSNLFVQTVVSLMTDVCWRCSRTRSPFSDMNCLHLSRSLSFSEITAANYRDRRPSRGTVGESYTGNNGEIREHVSHGASCGGSRQERALRVVHIIDCIHLGNICGTSQKDIIRLFQG